jgi:hypothetical protein
MDLAKTKISGIDEESISEAVYQALIGVDMEAIYTRPPESKRFRYMEPVEAVYEVVEETLAPFE